MMRTKLISLNFIPVKNFAIHNSSMLNLIFKYKKKRKKRSAQFSPTKYSCYNEHNKIAAEAILKR